MDGQVVALLVVGQVLHHVGGVRVLRARLSGHDAAGQGRERGRGEQVQRVPGVLPGSARGALGVEDDEVELVAAQVVADGESCLPAADHHHVHGVGHGAVVREPAPNLLRQASAT